MRRAELLTVGSLVVDYINNVKKIGGAASNVAVNVHELGLSSSMLTALSDEDESREYTSKLENNGITVHGLPTKLNQLPRCVIHMGEDGKEAGYEWFGNGIEELFQASKVDESIIKNAPFVYLAICESIFASKVATVVSDDQILSFNPGSRVFEGLEQFKIAQSRADHIFLNEREYGHLVAEGYVQEPSELIVRPNQVAILTAGAKETMLVSADSVETFSTEKVAAVDETGAGDSFASAFLWARAQGYPLDRCIQLGNLLASFVVQRVGAQIDADTASKFKLEARKRQYID